MNRNKLLLAITVIIVVVIIVGVVLVQSNQKVSSIKDIENITDLKIPNKAEIVMCDKIYKFIFLDYTNIHLRIPKDSIKEFKTNFPSDKMHKDLMLNIAGVLQVFGQNKNEYNVDSGYIESQASMNDKGIENTLMVIILEEEDGYYDVFIQKLN